MKKIIKSFYKLIQSHSNFYKLIAPKLKAIHSSVNKEEISLNDYEQHFMDCINNFDLKLATEFLDSNFKISKNLGLKINEKIEELFVKTSKVNLQNFSYLEDTTSAVTLAFIIKKQLFTEDTLPFLIDSVKSEKFKVSSLNTLFKISSPKPTLFSLNAGLYSLNNKQKSMNNCFNSISFKEEFYNKNINKNSLELFDIYYDKELLDVSFKHLTIDISTNEFFSKLSKSVYTAYPLLNFPDEERESIKLTGFACSLLGLIPSIIDFEITQLKKNPYTLFKNSLYSFNSKMTLEDYSTLSIYIFKKYQEEIKPQLTSEDLSLFSKLLKTTIPLFETNVDAKKITNHIDMFIKKFTDQQNLETHQELLQKFKDQHTIFNFLDYAYTNNIQDDNLETIKKIAFFYDKIFHQNLQNDEEKQFLDNLPQTIKKIIDNYNDFKEMLGDKDNSAENHISSMLNNVTTQIETVFHQQQKANIEKLLFTKNKIKKIT